MDGTITSGMDWISEKLEGLRRQQAIVECYILPRN